MNQNKNGMKFLGWFLAAFLIIKYWDMAVKVLGVAVSAAFPLLIGSAIAYVVNILMVFYEKHYRDYIGKINMKSWKRVICMLLAIISFLAIVAFVIGLIVPELTSCIALLLKEIPPAFEALLEKLQQNRELGKYVDEIGSSLTLEQKDIEALVQKAIQVFSTGFGDVVSTVVTIVTSVFSVAVTILVAVIFSIYLLLSKEQIAGGTKRVLKIYCPRQYEKLTYVLRTMNNCFHSYIVGQCTEAVILGVLCIAGMMIFRFPYATMIGTLVGFTALIPVAGAYIGASVGMFMIFTVSPQKALLFLIFILVLQQLENNLIYPKVVGLSIGLPGILVLAAVTIGGGVFGIPGMMIGVPLVATCYQLLKSDVKKRENSL